MIIKLNADQRELLQNTYSSFLTANTSNGSSTITLVNASGIDQGTGMDGYKLLIGELSNQTSEIVEIASVTGNVITLAANTQFSHVSGIRVYLLEYDKVDFYYNNDIDTGTAVLLTSQDTNANSYFSTYADDVNETGYGWYKFKNSVTNEESDWSNPIPYTDFPENSAYKIIDRFLEDLNDTEQKKLNKELLFSWLSEGYADAKTKLNVVNRSHSLQRFDVTLIPGINSYSINDIITGQNISEYTFSKLSNVIDENGEDLPKKNYEDINPFNLICYSIVNDDTIIFDPIPTSGKIYTLFFKTNAGALKSYWDKVVLPDNNFYIMNDYLLGRSAVKLNRPELAQYMAIYDKKINDMKISSFRQDSKPVSFTFDPSALA